MKKTVITGIIFMFIVSLSSSCYGYDITYYAQKNNMKKVKMILEADPAKVNYKDKDGHSPLMGAIDGGHYNMALFLLRNGADPSYRNKKGKGWTPLIFAVQMRSHRRGLRIVKLLIAYGANVNTATNEHQSQAVHYACWYGDRKLEIFKYLVEHGANVNARNDGGTTPLRFLIYDIPEPKQKMMKYIRSVGGKE